MLRIPIAAAALAGLAIAFSGPSFAADEENMNAADKQMIVVDAPDLFKVSESGVGPRFSTLMGREVFSNRGNRIGEIEDFVMARGGNIYAVIDTSKDPISDLLDLNNDEVVIVPLRELRESDSFDRKSKDQASRN